MKEEEEESEEESEEEILTTATLSRLEPALSAASTMDEIRRRTAIPTVYKKFCRGDGEAEDPHLNPPMRRCLMVEETHHFGPAFDADLLVQPGGEEDEEQQGEEEGRAADELKKVEGVAVPTAGDQLLQDEGHQGQDLRGGEQTLETEPSDPRIHRSKTGMWSGAAPQTTSRGRQPSNQIRRVFSQIC